MQWENNAELQQIVGHVYPFEGCKQIVRASHRKDMGFSIINRAHDTHGKV